MSRSFIGGPNDRRIKWWQGDEKRSRRWLGFTSKKIPGFYQTWPRGKGRRTGDNDRLLLQQLFEERLHGNSAQANDFFNAIYQAIVQRCRERAQVEPNVEGCLRRDADGKTHLREAREDVVALLLKVLLQCNLNRHGSSTIRPCCTADGHLPAPAGSVPGRAGEWRRLGAGGSRHRQGTT